MPAAGVPGRCAIVPPGIVIAPVLVNRESPPTLIAPPTPRPPLTTAAPVVVLLLAVAFVMLTTPVAPTVLLNCAAPLTVSVSVIVTSSPSAKSPST
jgi:hypothetical protein